MTKPNRWKRRVENVLREQDIDWSFGRQASEDELVAFGADLLQREHQAVMRKVKSLSNKPYVNRRGVDVIEELLAWLQRRVVRTSNDENEMLRRLK